MDDTDFSRHLTVENVDRKALTERIASLTPEQREIYRRRLRRIHPAEKPQIPVRRGSRPCPATTNQTALWFIQQLDPTSSAYNIGNGWRVRGNLDVKLLGKCLNLVIGRHEILRTSFKAIDGQPYQIVSDIEIKIPVADVSGSTDPENEACAVVTQWIKEPFDLEQAPLLRLPVVRIGAGDHVLIGVLHHIITDWWSYHLLFTELFGIYRAFTENRPNPFQELPIQYADWAAWYSEWEKSETFRNQETYWMRQLDGAPYVLELPADRPRPTIQSHQGAREEFVLPPEVIPRLRAMNRRAGTSSFMTFLGVLNVFLARLTGQEDFLVGTPVSADRDSKDLAGLIGYMLNTVVLRANLSGHPNLLQVLKRVRNTCLEAFAHKEFPFARLVERLRPGRDLSRMPVYQVEYVYVTGGSPVPHAEDVADWKLELPGFEITSFGAERNRSPVDLQVGFVEAPDLPRLRIEYNSDIFEEETVRAMGEGIIDLLDILLAQPERSITSIPPQPLKKAKLVQRLEMLEKFNTRAPEVGEKKFLELFEAQVLANPDREALLFGDSLLTYGELNRRANQMAHHLRDLGVGAEVLVGVCLHRVPEMLITMVAVLKAGGAYLPLDPGYPKARLAQILRDASPLLVVTTVALSDSVVELSPVLQLDSPEIRSALSRASVHNPVRDQARFALLPRQAAYIIYTSGSTGLHKGVVIEHQSATMLAAWVGSVFSSEELSGILSATAIAFDLSVFELLVTLTHGGTVILAQSILDLPVIPARNRVRLINTVPSAARALLDLHALPSSVQTINLAGEVLSNSLVQDLYGAGQVNRIFNLYGPSEATTYSTFAYCVRNTNKEPAIGTPIWNTRTYVLNPNLEPLSAGVMGELYVAGEGLARGYLNRPALTAEQFIPDPYGAPGTRMYRTGDLARWTPEGQLEFGGRLDRQVKVRGYRIELDEIEAALAAQNEVAQAVAMVREDQPNDKQIVAYVVADPKKIFDMPKVRQHLIQALPGYMVPAALVRLEKFPLTTSGKLDRKALPPPEEDAYARPQYEAPRGEIESTIARIWAEMLKIERVGREDNFFELGGHSLLAVSVIERMRREGLNVDTWMLFVRPTVAALAGDLKGKPKLIVVPKNQIPDFGRRRNQPSEGLEFWL